jgi:hypothetical protein
MLKERLAADGFDPDEFSGHSLRAGFVTSALYRASPTPFPDEFSGHSLRAGFVTSALPEGHEGTTRGTVKVV